MLHDFTAGRKQDAFMRVNVRQRGIECAETMGLTPAVNIKLTDRNLALTNQGSPGLRLRMNIRRQLLRRSGMRGQAMTL